MKAAKRTRGVQTTKKAYPMSDAAFTDLEEALEDALAFERGERGTLKITRVQILYGDSNLTKDRPRVEH